ncbi:hypothetical protein M3148_10050 [Georgenia satyanarayanai]|uniref:lipopolysaccharide biosynthesis protein n=1 Tax=Georgenia satyanarayanai TaxID=860221 RepID=UPI00203CD209|nr:hypothetical protein [Georgenia satyanarayanai]MCM3661325.1 hypothetical protein [Georgenia satyanarayanai]
MSRTRKSGKNFLFGTAFQAVTIGANLAIRVAFLRILGTEYLGLSEFFLSTVALLSLTEMGAGVAFGYFLYAPLAVRDEVRIAKLLNFYRSVYRMIAIGTLVLGAALAPVMFAVVNTEIGAAEFFLAYAVFVVDACITYLFAHKRTLIAADQNQWVVSAYATGATLARLAFQFAVLYAFPQFVLYVLVQLLTNLLQNAAISNRANRAYPFIVERRSVRLDKQEVAELRKYMWAMVMHRVGATAARSTDNLVLGIAVGVSQVAYLANYRLVIAAVERPVLQLYSAMAASIGNLGATATRERSYSAFRAVFVMNAWVGIVCSVGLATLLNEFIDLWLGSEYVLSQGLVLILAVNFLFQIMRQSTNTFKTSWGLFWNDRFRPLAEAVVNVGASLLLVGPLGIGGVLIGTSVGFVLVNMWTEPYVLYRYGFGRQLREYFVGFASVVAGAAVLYVIVTLLMSLLPNDGGFWRLLVAASICLATTNGALLLALGRTREFATLYGWASSLWRR